MKNRKLVLSTLICAMLILFSFSIIFGQENYPRKSITYIIPFNPGGQSDITAQYQKEDLREILGVNILIKHMPGAGGAVAWSKLVKTKPDGYTISGNNVPHIIIQPLVRDNAGYETEQLVPVYCFQTTPIGLAVLKESEFKTLDQFVNYAKTHPGEITIGGSGTHSGHHLALLQLQKLTGVKFTYIPSTGAAPSVANFLGGHTMALFANSNDLYTHEDKITILAMGTDDRFGSLPDAPTFKELGVPMTAGIDRGVCVPHGTPPEVIKTLEDAFRKVCMSPAFVNKMEDLAFLVRQMGAEEYKRYIADKKREIIETLKELGEL
jgi:tripartite-type tricarboxylate transporter receptor subunit TctC